jgi:hypothetical protein
MLAHLRTEAYPVYGTGRFPPAGAAGGDAASALSYERNSERIDEAKRAFASHGPSPRVGGY